MFTRELDHDVLRCDTAATHATGERWPTPAELLVDRGPGYVPLSDGACFADVNGVAS